MGSVRRNKAKSHIDDVIDSLQDGFNNEVTAVSPFRGQAIHMLQAVKGLIDHIPVDGDVAYKVNDLVELSSGVRAFVVGHRRSHGKIVLNLKQGERKKSFDVSPGDILAVITPAS